MSEDKLTWTHLDICQFRGTSMVSRLIRCFNWGPYSHTALRVPETGAVYEAWSGGVQKVPSISTNHTKGTVVDVWKIALWSEQAMVWLDWMDKQIGKKYDYMGIMGFVFRRDWDATNKFFCSELVVTGNLMSAKRVAGSVLIVNDMTPPHKVYPAMVTYSPNLVYSHQEVTE